MTSVRVACIQLNAKADLTANLDEAEHWIRLARADGAQFIATPENTSGMYRNRGALLDSALPEAGHPGDRTLRRPGAGNRRLAAGRIDLGSARE